MSRQAVPRLGLGQALAFLRDPARFTAGAGLRLGDIYRVPMPGYRLHVVTDPALVEKILVHEADSFVKSRIYWRELRRSMGDSMGALDGAEWSYLHRIQHPFFSPKAVRRYLPDIERNLGRLLDEVGPPKGAEASLDVIGAFSEANARVVLSVLFGLDQETPVKEVVERIDDGNNILAWRSKFPWRSITAVLNGTNRRAARHKAFFTAFVDRLRAMATSGGRETLLTALTRVEDDPEAPHLSPELLRNEVMFHLGASTETQAAAQGWALYLLWRHPQVLERLQAEVDGIDGGRAVGAEDLDSLPLARRVMQEALRLYPPVYGVVRDAVEGVDLGGLRAGRGDTFLISVYGLHRSPRLWKDPGEFIPDRFLPERAAELPRYQYIPFGAGRHVCIGQHLALPTMTLTIAKLAQRFVWSFPEGEVRPEARPSLKPSGPFRATLVPRRPVR